MKQINKEYYKVITIPELTVYKYEELTDDAKRRAREWYTDDPRRPEWLAEDIEWDLNQALFPNSNLKVQFSLSYCQGDGLNVYGRLKLADFLEIDKRSNYNIFKDYTAKELRRLHFYIDGSRYELEFSENRRDGHSCKFLDRKDIDWYIEDFFDNYVFDGLRDIDIDLMKRLFDDIFDFFERYDKEMEKEGYKFLYDPDDEEIIDDCDANEWYFTKEGEYYAE